MACNWEALIQRANGEYVVTDFQQAAYQLVTEQVLYETNPLQRTSFRIIKAYEQAYREFAMLMGLLLDVNPGNRYAAVVPVATRTTALSRRETLFLLSIRQVFHNRMMAGDEDGNRPVVSIPEVETACKAHFGHDLMASKPEWRELLQLAKRYGMAREAAADELSEQPFAIEILPAIEFLLSGATLARAGAEFQAVADLAPAGEEEADETA